MANSGFHHELLVEFNQCAVATLKQNHDGGQAQIKELSIKHDDVRNVSFESFQDKVSIVAGGPPWQLFSLGNSFPLAESIMRLTMIEICSRKQ